MKKVFLFISILALIAVALGVTIILSNNKSAETIEVEDTSNLQTYEIPPALENTSEYADLSIPFYDGESLTRETRSIVVIKDSVTSVVYEVLGSGRYKDIGIDDIYIESNNLVYALITAPSTDIPESLEKELLWIHSEYSNDKEMKVLVNSEEVTF